MLMLAALFITTLYKWLRNLFVAASRKNVKMSQGILSITTTQGSQIYELA